MGTLGENSVRTTGLQVSGYSFLLRRLELALVTGDPRMAHDPLRTQRRAVGVGVLLALLVAGGMFLMAMLRPAPSIGDSMLVADESGALYVRIEDVFHPVTNVASARLVLGSAEEVSKTTSANLAEFPTGPPIGIPDAPGLVAASQQDSMQWVLCGDSVVVADGWKDAGPQVVSAPSGFWLVVDGTRMLIPNSGPQVARALGAQPVEVADATVMVFPRGPDIALPRGASGMPGQLSQQGTVVTVDERAFIVSGKGLAELTGARWAIVSALAEGEPVDSDLGTVLANPGATVFSHISVDLNFREVTQACAGSMLVEALPESLWENPARFAERGTDLSTRFRVDGTEANASAHFWGPRGTTALVTERGLVLVSGTGIRYTVASSADMTALGVLKDGELPVAVSWRVIEGLPDGGELSAARARRTVEVD